MAKQTKAQKRKAAEAGLRKMSAELNGQIQGLESLGTPLADGAALALRHALVNVNVALGALALGKGA